MRPHMRSDMRPHCEGTCDQAWPRNANSDTQSSDQGKGCSPNPSEVPLHLRVYAILDGGIASLPANDYGRPWPLPNRATLRRLCAEHPEDLCLKAAREAREIVQAQDRAPNITGLYEKKLRDLAAEQAERDGVRETIRESLGDAA